jgi:nucleoside-diphosphate-sugar epimerase
MTTLITGATGFIGSALSRKLRDRQGQVRGAARHTDGLIEGVEPVQIVSSGLDVSDWKIAMKDCSTVVHLAARAHVLDERSRDPLTEFRSVNVALTQACAHAAAASGVRLFVYVSSIGVLGNQTAANVFDETNEPCPHSPYAVSKHEAEQSLREIAKRTAMSITILRPPLVYGPRAPGNFAAMLRWLQLGFPLPLGAVTHNRRSFVALDNLVDLLITCIDHPAAANQTFLVSDGEDLSTADLLRRLGHAMNKPARLFPVTPSLLQLGANILGKGDMAQRLLGNLQVDISHTRNTLNWSPPISVDEGLRRAVAGLTL